MIARIYFGIVSIFLGALWPAPGFARFGEISKADIEYFLQESHAGHKHADREKDWEDFLYRSAEKGKSPSETVRLFAEEIGVTKSDAAVIADAIIEITRFGKNCPEDREKNYDCRFTKGSPAYDKFLAANALDETGELAFVIGKMVGSKYDPVEWRKHYLDVVVLHPGRTLTFRRMLAYTRDDLWVCALAAAGEIDNRAAGLIFLRSYYGTLYESPSWDGASLALTELLLTRSNLDSETRALLSFAQISLQMRLGLSEAAAASYRLLPATITDYFPSEDGAEKRYKSEDIFTNFIECKIELAIVLFEQGRKESAKRLLDETKAIIASSSESGKHFSKLVAIAEEVLSPKLSREDVFDYFVYGHLPGEPEPEDEDAPSMRGTAGWLFAIENRIPAFRSIAADYLARRDYSGMSNFLEMRQLYYRADRTEELIDTLRPLLPANYVARKEYWRGRIDYVWNRHEASQEGGEPVPVSGANTPLTPPRHFVEAPLPEEFQTEKREESNRSKPKEPELPAGFAAPVNEWQIVRRAEENGERQIIFISSALDAPGEIPAYGYWFQQTRDNGAAWDEPLYLGLIQFFPYLIVADSRMPLLSDSGLTIEVEAREIDPATISFPPVGLGFKRVERNLSLTIKFDDITRDSDGDGLADLVERRLQMNPKSADTDGDGLEDARDPLPLTKYDLAAPAAKKELAYSILSAIVGFERQAIMVAPGTGGGGLDEALAAMGAAAKAPKISDGAEFLRADPGIFSGVRTPFRLFVFNSAQVKRINAEGAPFYPAQVSAIFSRPNGLEHYVIWSAGWAGGEFIVRCNNENRCETEITSSWIS